MLHHDSVICKKCHDTILQESLLTCIICENTVAKKCLVGKHKYSLLKHTMPQMANIPNSRRHICKTCYLQLQKILYVCVAAEMLRKVCVNFIEKLTMTFQPLLYHDAYHM